MISELLKPEIQDFILAHEHDDPGALMLQASKYPKLPMRLIVEQLQSRKKAKSKVPEWSKKEQIIYPPTLSLEQCSSATTALYKQKLLSGKVLVDLTGGMGVDSYYLSKSFDEVHYVEQDPHLAAIAGHNFSLLNAGNIQVNAMPADRFLTDFTGTFDAVFVDPARRDQSNKKVFRLAECEPNLIELLPRIKRSRILIKAAPLLDIKSAIADLGGVTMVHVVAVQGEVKELLFLIEDGDNTQDPLISCVDLRRDTEDKFQFRFSEEASTEATYGTMRRYLYEPNSAVLKGGAFKSFAAQSNLLKLHPNSHLYTSDELLIGFHSRVFEVKQQLSFSKKTLRKQIPDLKANISVRNFPMTVAQIRQKTGLKEGGDQYIFATRDQNGTIIFLCDKID